MNYEKVYKEALERAKNLYSGVHKGCKEVIENVFPELAENEDERIRKVIYDFFSLAGNTYELCGIPNANLLAYLEKQKEPKPEWSEEDSIGWDEAFACVTRAEKAAKNEEELQNAVTAEKWLKEIKFKYYVHPVKQEWSEEDEKIWNGLIEFFASNSATPFSIYEVMTPVQILNFLKSIRNRPKSSDTWKPSEEQISAIVEALKYLPNNKEEWAILNGLIDVFKKLKED